MEWWLRILDFFLLQEAEQSIIRLQAKCENAPNEVILKKLRDEMLAFYDKVKQVSQVPQMSSYFNTLSSRMEVPHQKSSKEFLRFQARSENSFAPSSTI